MTKPDCLTYLDDIQLSDGLRSGSLESAVVVACSDMGLFLPFVCSHRDVNVEIVQNFGHQCQVSALSSVLHKDGLMDLIVYGHDDCRYIRSISASADAVMIKHYFGHQGEGFMQRYSEGLATGTQESWLQLVQCCVLGELQTLLQDRLVAQRVEEGSLRLHGWLYRSETRELNVYDPRQQAFALAQPLASG